ncbi:hypothetical protein C4559_02135 [Candidatus Microgenomates bacterium]|nr:MAG: hypothetical protein C4559_02135 [Candidatus Microgenomates bacterium]
MYLIFCNLFLRYFLTKNKIHLWFLLLITFIFSNNFAWGSAPPVFAFYPLAILFIIIYTVFIRRKTIPIKGLFIGLIIFVGLHAFDLLPAILGLFDPGSTANNGIFNRTLIAQQLGYFYGVLTLASLSKNMLLSIDLNSFSFFAPLSFLFILGLLFAKRSKTLSLTAIFYLLTLYLLSARVTNSGIKLYEMFFLYVPAFSMFRNFIVQWLFVFSFFGAIFFAQSLFFVLLKFPKKIALVFSLIITAFLILGSFSFLKGNFVNRDHPYAPTVKIPMTMDKKYEEMLSYIKALPEDTKVLVLPFSDYNYQVVYGLNNGAYVGVSTISKLTGKSDFPGYFYLSPFSGLLLNLVKDQNYDAIKRLLGILNIKYIFYNSDPNIYTGKFTSYPYQYVRTFFPSDQKGYVPFVKNISEKEVFKINNYNLYSSDINLYLPHIYIAKRINAYENKVNDWYGKTESFFVNDRNNEPRVAYLEKDTCFKNFSKDVCEKNNDFKKVPKIIFEKINPTKYKITVYSAENPYILVFSDTYHNSWKLFDSTNKNYTFWGKLEGFVGDITKTLAGKFIKEPKDRGISTSYFEGFIKEGIHREDFLNPLTFETWGKKTIAEDKHFQVNGYANAWYIEPNDMGGKRSYEIILEMTRQKTFYIGLTISVFTLITFLLWGIFVIIKDIGIIKYIGKSYKNDNKK